MRKRDRRELERYVRWVADEMELRDWTIEVSSEPPGRDDAIATMQPVDGRKLAVMRLCPGFRDREAEDQRHTIVHEILHCHFAAADHAVENDLEGLLGKPADGIFYEAFRRSLEYGIDATAAAVAKHLPLIDWPVS